MADTTFVSKVTHIVRAWMQDVNDAVYKGIGTGAGGVAPTSPADVRTNLGLTANTAPTGASLIGCSSSLGATVQAFITALASSAGAAGVGNNPAGNIGATNVQNALNELDAEKAKLAGGNNFTGVNGVGGQKLDYNCATATTGNDQVGFQALVHKIAGGSTDNVVALVGHGYHDGTFNVGSGVWGIATEAWTNPTNYATLVGGEFAVISQCPTMGNPSVGVNAVFKNRPDVAANPTAPVGNGTLYNRNASAILVTSQRRPSGAGAAWGGVGSGWQAAFRIGDPNGGGPGLDWEGGDNYPGSTTYKAYTSYFDVTNALKDLAGGWPWAFLYKNDQTYWGMRFNGTLTGALDTANIKVNNGGLGYAVADTGTITGGSGSGAKYYVKSVSGGAVTEIAITATQGSGYVTTIGATTAATTGGGSGLTVDISVATGLIYGAHLGITAGGTGYAVGDLVNLNGGTAGYLKPTIKVTTVAAGVVTGVELQAMELSPASVRLYTNGRGHTVGVGKTTTAITGVGTGLTISISVVHDDLVIGGEKWEYWRMLNPGNPIGTGARQGYIDASFPGTPLTIDTVAHNLPYTFPVDRPL